MSDSTLHMLQVFLDARKVVRWASARRLDAGDIGYTCHAILCDALGELRPQPFVAEEKAGRIKLLGYCASDAVAIQARIQDFAEPEVAGCIQDVSSKEMPASWQAGRRLGFKVRVSPTRQSRHESRRRREVDALLLEPDGSDREETYRRWLTERLAAAATVEACQMRGFTMFNACRRGIDSESGHRPASSVEIPDALFEGVLHVQDSQAFGALLAKGIGRHKAFGFGALMLKAA